MTPAPLNAGQISAVRALVAGRKLSVVPVDQSKCDRFLDQADDGLEALELVTSANVRYDVAYNAAHDVGEAMLAAYGYRTASGQGAAHGSGRVSPGDLRCSSTADRRAEL
jgi:hypothetical protein